MKDTNAIKSVVHGDHPALRDGDYVEAGAVLFDGGHSLINGLPDKFWPLILGHACFQDCAPVHGRVEVARRWRRGGPHTCGVTKLTSMALCWGYSAYGQTDVPKP